MEVTFSNITESPSQETFSHVKPTEETVVMNEKLEEILGNIPDLDKQKPAEEVFY